MSTFKKCKVVMLPTEKANGCLLKGFKTLQYHPKEFFTQEYLKSSGRTSEHLYITSDDEIKVNDYYISRSGHIQRSGDTRFDKLYDGCKKIIATTDRSIYPKCDDKCAKNECVCVFPQPSEGFIDVYVDFYNRGKPITEVMVEYEKVFGVHTPDFSDELKVNLKDNTITIKKVKDSWSREEVIALCKKCYDQIDMDESEYDFNTWIEENL